MSSSGVIFYIIWARGVHPCVRECTGKRHLLFHQTSHRLDLQSLLVDNADLAGANNCLHQVLDFWNPVS